MLKEALKLGMQKLWTLQREDLRQKHQLTYLFWECTLNCNFFCAHCGSRAGRKTHTDELSTEEIKKVFSDVAHAYNAKKITIAVTGGEPLMRKDLFEVMGYASQLGFPWGMVTNGFLVTEDKVRQMKEAGMKSIDVSIDGIGETHDTLRAVPGAYDHAIEALRLLLKAGFIKIVRVSTSVSQKNIHEIETLYEKFQSMGLKYWRLLSVDPIGRAMDSDDLILNTEQMTWLLRFIKKTRKEGKMDVTFGCSMFLGAEFEDEVRSYFFNCGTGINIGTVLHNGDIFVCPNVPRVPELIQGNARRDPFPEVWENKFKFFRDRNRTACDQCQKCEHWNECLGGSMHLWDFDQKKPKRCYAREICGPLRK